MRQNIAGWCQQWCFKKFVENALQCFSFIPQANFPTNNLNFRWMWRWWVRIKATFSNLFYFKANGFCSKDYPAMNEVAAELKWDLRSQIHPTVTQTASEPQTVSTIDFFLQNCKNRKRKYLRFMATRNHWTNLGTDNEVYMFEHILSWFIKTKYALKYKNFIRYGNVEHLYKWLSEPYLFKRFLLYFLNS